MGRSPQLWKDPDVFDPQRWDVPFGNPEVKGWAGYDPAKARAALTAFASLASCDVGGRRAGLRVEAPLPHAFGAHGRR